MSSTTQAITPQKKSLTLVPGNNHILYFSQIQKIVIGKKSLVKVKALDSQTLVLTPKKKGRTTVHVWSHQNKSPHIFHLNIVPPHLKTTQEDKLISISIRIFDINNNKMRSLGIRLPQQFRWDFLNNITQYNPMESQHEETHDITLNQSYPTLLVKNGEQVSFESGGELPILTSQPQDRILIQTVKWKKYGLSLTLTPTLKEKNTFHASIKIEASTPQSTRSEFPEITVNKIETQLIGSLSETYCFSGFVSRTDSQGTQSTPILSRLPIFSLLTQTKHSQKKNLTQIICTQFKIQKQEESL